MVVRVEGIKCLSLLDTCSGNSYASAALIDFLHKRSSGKEVRHVEMMLSSVAKEMELSTVCAEDVNGESAMDVWLLKLTKESCCLWTTHIMKS